MNLDMALQNLNNRNLPLPMPIVHTTKLEYLDQILKDGCLRVTDCTMFQRKLLYFFYGGPFYRPNFSKEEERKDITWAPISLMFRPSVMVDAKCFFPYDTGAVRDGLYGDEWSKKLADFDHFRICGNRSKRTPYLPAKLIKHIFGSNDDYWLGILRNYSDGKLSLPLPLQELCNFYQNRPLDNSNSADKRRCMLECHFEQPLLLEKNLMWICIPRREIRYTSKIKKAFLDQPKIADYPWHLEDEPLLAIGKIEQEAQRYLREHSYLRG